MYSLALKPGANIEDLGKNTLEVEIQDYSGSDKAKFAVGVGVAFAAQAKS